MSIDIFYISRVRVEQQDYQVVNGQPTVTWTQATHPDPKLNALLRNLPCRLDLNYLRPGRDTMPAVNAGRAPDRIGVMFCDHKAPLRAGMRVVTVPSPDGSTPISGTFEIRVIPDIVIGYSTPHHLEIQVLETNQELVGLWPDDDSTGD